MFEKIKVYTMLKKAQKPLARMCEYTDHILGFYKIDCTPPSPFYKATDYLLGKLDHLKPQAFFLAWYTVIYAHTIDSNNQTQMAFVALLKGSNILPENETNYLLSTRAQYINEMVSKLNKINNVPAFLCAISDIALEFLSDYNYDLDQEKDLGILIENAQQFINEFR